MLKLNELRILVRKSIYAAVRAGTPSCSHNEAKLVATIKESEDWSRRDKKAVKSLCLGAEQYKEEVESRYNAAVMRGNDAISAA